VKRRLLGGPELQRVLLGAQGLVLGVNLLDEGRNMLPLLGVMNIERTVAAGARGLDTRVLEGRTLPDGPLVKVAENIGPDGVLLARGQALGRAAGNASVPRRPIDKVLHSFVGRVDGLLG